MRLRARSIAVVLTVAAAASGCAHPGGRYFQASADQIGPDPNSYGEVVVPLHGLIAVQGDELAYGLSRGRSRHQINGADRGQSSLTISQVLRRAISGVTVENRGYPGDTVAQSEARWAGSKRANLVILCVGFGDAAAHTPVDDFGHDLAQAIKTARAQGAAVFVVTAPRLSDPLEDHDLGEYRDRAKSVAREGGAVLFETQSAMDRLKQRPVKTVAQAPQVYQAVAADMVPYIKVVRDVRS